MRPLPAALPQPRDGWKTLEETAKKLFTIPGPRTVRELVASTCFIPKVRWAAPFIEVPPLELNGQANQ